ncbi:MAG: prepilin-type N-terminal cleavage/methylation domain-containing protein [bacterium]|nr:prepilin-type N-terminal cleavage/methylation domain-containing protein [bacterium]
MNGQSGVSMIELLAALAILGLAASVATVNVERLETPLTNGAAMTQGFFKQVRTRAIATTSAYRVFPSDTRTLVADFADTCDAATWTEEPGFRVELPTDVRIPDTEWVACFTNRGLSDDNVSVTLRHPEYEPMQVEVLLGGATRIVQ